MKSKAINATFANLALHILGFSLCIVPPMICTLTYFPMWKSSGFESCISGGTALLLVLCFFPLTKFLTKAIKQYGAYVAWLLCFIIFLALSKIADQMIVISLIGFLGNLSGEICFILAKKRRAIDEKE